MPVVYFGICWFMGIGLAAVWSGSWYAWLILSISGLLGALILRRQAHYRLAFACLTAVGLGGMRYVAAVPTIDNNHTAYYNDGDPVALTGLVSDEPDIRDRYVNLRLDADSIADADGTIRPITGSVLIRSARFPVIAYGTRLQITGELETPPEDESFSYKAYLERQGIHSLMGRPRLTVLAEREGNPLYHAIYAVKDHAQATINQLIPDPQAALLSGILLGNDNGIPPELAEDFRATGMTHIIAISGFNIAILIAILVSLGEPIFSRRGAVFAAIIGITLYTLLVGADASVVRAAIMGGLFLLVSRMLGRPNFAFASLFLAGFVMTLINPYTLWDVGFQLSFTATLGLMLYADPITQWSRRQLQRGLDREMLEKVMGVLTEAVLITIAAQILTLPLMIAYFGQLSLISLPANALILPIQPGVMTWGGLATLSGMIVPQVGQIFAWIAWLFLTGTIELVRMFARVPGATMTVQVSWIGVVGIYGVIAAVTWYAQQTATKRQALRKFIGRNLTQRLALGGSLAAVLLVGRWGFTQPDGLLHVTFLDVGQGDAIFIQTPEGRQILVDGGYYPSILNAHLGQQMPFWDKELDMMVATHPDADHVSGLVEVFDRYQVGQLITEGSGLGESDFFDEFLLAAEDQGTSLHTAVAGEVFDFGDGVRLEVVHPGPERHPDNRNENSVSLRLVYDDFSLLLTGDAETEGEEEMLRGKRPLKALVFKAGHHGPQTSSTPPFLTAVQPQIIIVSAGKDNKFGHPHPDVLRRAQDMGAAVLRTDELGTIEVMSDGHKMWWQARP